MLLLLRLGRLTWSSVSHLGLLRFVQITRWKVNLNRLKNYSWVIGILRKVIVDTTNKTANKFRHNIRPFGPSKCLVYVRLSWIGSPSQLIADMVSFSVTRCYNAAMVRTIFTTWAAFHSAHKVLLIFQQNNLIYKFQCCCNASYIGHTLEHLEVRVKQHVPRDICNHTSGHSKLLDSVICEHLSAINSCAGYYNNECFGVLHRARTKQHLLVLEALYILLYIPTLCKQNEALLKFTGR